MFISKAQKKLIAVNINDGNILWEIPININLYREPLYFHKRNILLVCKDQIYIVDSINGKIEKEVKIGQNIKKLLIKENKIYIITENNLIVYELPAFKKIYERKFDESLKNLLFIENMLYLFGKKFALRCEIP